MQIIYLWAQIATGHSAQGGFGKLYAGCQRLLYKANRALWPRASRIYSLYSARHQFGANAKQKLSREEVAALMRSEEHTSELQSLMRNAYAVFCLKKKKT